MMPTSGFFREFHFYLLSRFFFVLGMKMIPVLLGWFLYERTGSALVLGLVGLSEVVPAILMALPAGVAADTGHKKRIISICLVLFLLILTLLLYAVTRPVFGDVETYCIYGLVGFTGIIRAYMSPAFSALLSQVVPPEELVSAASVNSLIWLSAAVAGPFIAGIGIGWLGVSGAFMIAIGSVAVSLLSISVLSAGARVVMQSGRTWDSVVEGIQFVRGQEALMGTMALDMFAVLFGGAVALLPVYAKDVLFVGPFEFGLLQSATYAGNFLAILYLTFRPLRHNQGTRLLQAVFGFGICIIIFGISTWFRLSLAALFMSGLLDGISVVIRGTIFQILVPDHMRGRVSAVNSVFINSSNELGQFESGLAASMMGTVPSVLFGGVMTLLITGYFGLRLPALKKLNY